MYNREYKPWHIRADDQNLYKVFLDNESFNDIFDIIMRSLISFFFLQDG